MFFQHEEPEFQRIFHGGVGKDVHFGHGEVEHFDEDHDRGDEIQGRGQGETFIGNAQLAALISKRFGSFAEVAVFMEHSLGIAGGSGGIDSVSRIVIVGYDKSFGGRGIHDRFPVLRIDLQLAAAILPDEIDPFRRVGILYQGEGGAGTPDPHRGDQGLDPARQVDQNEIFFSDSVVLQEGADLAAEFVELAVGQSFGGRFIVKECMIGIVFQMFRQFFCDPIHFFLFSKVIMVISSAWAAPAMYSFSMASIAGMSGGFDCVMADISRPAPNSCPSGFIASVTPSV